MGIKKAFFLANLLPTSQASLRVLLVTFPWGRFFLGSSESCGPVMMGARRCGCLDVVDVGERMCD